MSTNSPDPNAASPPGFEILTKLGEGGMGSVWRARDRNRDREVAIKFVDHGADATGEARARFAREARVMARVQHPNIVQVFEHGTFENYDYLVMELVDGQSLRTVIDDTGKLAPIQARQILADIGAAVGCLHDQHVVHRDLKPGNVLVATDGTIKLTDFGISSPIAELGQITNTNEFVGSLDYMSPEQRTRLPVDERADQFALGVIAYEMLTGRLPIGNYKAPSKLCSDLPPEVDAVIATALEEDPDDRFPSIAELVDRLATALAVPSRSSPLPGLLLTGTGLLLAMGFWIERMMSGDEQPPVATSGKPTAPEPRLDTPSPTPHAPSPRPTDDPTAPTIDWATLAEQQFAAGNLEAATKAMNEAIKIDGSDANLFRIRGLIHKTNGMFELALSDLLKAYRMDPEFVDALVGAASIHVNLKDYPRAIELCDEALAKAPATATAYAWRGWAHHGIRDDERAQQDLDTAIRLDPDCGIAYQWRGFLAKQRKDWQAVGRDYGEFVRCHPDDPYGHRLYASFLALCADRKLRNPALALRHATRACELTQHQSWGALRVLAYAQAANRDFEAAIATCKRAIPLAPENRRDLLRGQQLRYERSLQPKRHRKRDGRNRTSKDQ